MVALAGKLSTGLCHSPNAPTRADVLGTWMLSVLSGHKRYAHVTAIRCDGVNPGLLGMRKVISEDALRNALKRLPEAEGEAWLDGHLAESVAPLLDAPWILDTDTTVKPLYGKQEGALIAYNPKKPGRPSHSYHTYLMAGLRLVAGVEVRAGNAHAAKHSQPGLLKILDDLPAGRKPKLVRGDNAFGNDALMAALEERGQPYLFKLKLSKPVLSLSKGTSSVTSAVCFANRTGRTPARVGRARTVNSGSPGGRRAAGWSCCAVRFRAKSWSRGRGQQLLAFVEADRKAGKGITGYEYAVLVTHTDYAILGLGQLYRDKSGRRERF